MSKEILEPVGIATEDRPIKGFALDMSIYIAETKQAVIDEQTISLKRVANLVVWARDIAKFMVFSDDGLTYEEKDLPSGDVDVSDFASLTGDNVFEGDSTYEGSTSEPKSLMTKEAVEALVPTGSTFMTPEETALLIESNNDEIINPNQGSQFQLIDADKSSGYGDNGSITYYGPDYSGGQSSKLINSLSNSKSYFVHKETSSQHGFAMLHESYVSQIYNKDVNGVSELTMLFGPKSRGRYAKSNQVTPAGMVLNWNGEYLPDTEDPNSVNPANWIDLAGNVTQEWSYTGIKTACYSIGLLVNDGSALLQRGDVFCHDNAGVKTSTFAADNASEFFVIPIKTGGGTLSDLKLLPLFMSRLHTTQKEWESYTFDNSADCVGTILKIAYDSAIESSGDNEKLVAAIAENNLVQADLQTRFGMGTVEVNNLEFTVDSITANNLNGEQ